MSVSRGGSKRAPTKPLRSKRSADTMAEGEVGFPMPSRPRMSLALPAGERPLRHTKNDAVDAVLGPLSSAKKMTSKVYCLTRHHACHKALLSPSLGELEAPFEFLGLL